MVRFNMLIVFIFSILFCMINYQAHASSLFPKTMPSFDIRPDSLKLEIYNAMKRIEWIEIYDDDICTEKFDKLKNVALGFEPGFSIIGLSTKNEEDKKLASIAALYYPEKDILKNGISHFNILCRILIETVVPNILEQEADEIFSLSGLEYDKNGSVVRKSIRFTYKNEEGIRGFQVQKIK